MMHTIGKQPGVTESGEVIFTVGELNQQIREYLEKNYSQIWVCGEVSNFTQASSGHMYFSIKDASGQIRCAFFRQKQLGLFCQPKNGMQVLLSGKLSLYAERGDYQLIVHSLQDYGAGQLQQQYEQLKAKLQQAGLFDAMHKQGIPERAKQIGIITSAKGAALQDVISVVKRRYPIVKLSIYDTLVQGEHAARSLIQGIEYFNQTADCDVILLTRGGGSMEDLWAFNNEALAHVIFNSTIPIVSAVGHEIDFTIADFVADLRMPTPSAAAERLTPNQQDLLQYLKHYQSQLQQKILGMIKEYQLITNRYQSQLIHPKTRIQQQWQHLDFLQMRLIEKTKQVLAQARHHSERIQQRLQHTNPAKRIEQYQLSLAQKQATLVQVMQNTLNGRHNMLKNSADRLNNVSPLNTLARGYAMVKTDSGEIVDSGLKLSKGDLISVTLQDSHIDCQVNNIQKQSIIKSDN